jgi:DNA-binding XRE family transcriptional regulator
MNLPLPLPVERAIKKLGADLSLARRRRNMTQAMLAERLGTSVMTVRRMEDGQEHSYTKVVDAMRTACVEVKADVQQLWRRLVFNHLVTNVDLKKIYSRP